METTYLSSRRQQFDRVCKDLQNVVHDSERLLQTGLRSGRDQARVALTRADRLMHEKPYQSVGVCFAAGLVMGLLAAALTVRRSD